MKIGKTTKNNEFEKNAEEKRQEIRLMKDKYGNVSSTNRRCKYVKYIYIYINIKKWKNKKKMKKRWNIY